MVFLLKIKVNEFFKLNFIDLLKINEILLRFQIPFLNITKSMKIFEYQSLKYYIFVENV